MPPRGKPMTCALQLYNHHACMSYRKQLPVTLPGHGCATRKSHDSEKKNLKSSKDNYSATYLLKYKASLAQKGQIANNLTLKYQLQISLAKTKLLNFILLTST